MKLTKLILLFMLPTALITAHAQPVPEDDQLWYALQDLGRFVSGNRAMHYGAVASVPPALVAGVYANRSVANRRYPALKAKYLRRAWLAGGVALAIVMVTSVVQEKIDHGHVLNTGEAVRFLRAQRRGQIQELDEFLARPIEEQYALAHEDPDFRDYIVNLTIALRMNTYPFLQLPVRKGPIPR